MPKNTALIIGAGPAGLTAAYTLLKETDICPVILEESPYIGGISRTAVHNGNRMDLGGHRFFSKNAEVNALWDELMPLQGKPSRDDSIVGADKTFHPNGPDPEKEDRVMLLRNRVSRIYYLRKFFDYPISLKPQTFANMGLKRTVKAGFGYLRAAVVKKEETSLENFYINRFGKPLYEMFFEDYTTKLWGVSPAELSAEWGAQRVKGLSLMKAVMSVFHIGKKETSLIEQFSYPKLGPGQFWETLASEIEKRGGIIIKDTRVESVKLAGNRIESVTAVNGGVNKAYTADYYISSMPIKDLVAGMGEAAPKDVAEIAEALPYRDFMTVGLLVDKLKLKNETKIKTVSGNVPDCWIYIQERDVRLGRLQIFNNWSPYLLKDPENTVFVGLEYFCDEGDEYWNMSDAEFIRFAVDELVKIGAVDRDAVLDSVRLKVKKAYPAYFGAYTRFDTVREYLSSIDNLYCVGRNGQHRYNNMDHSMLTAVEAVRAIRTGSGKKELWNVNTEQEYHESK